ncbi:class I SAM-dependent methyltransferase [Neobacillus notoginsengisoli]|uniref:Class I SAM-dependent methyltransferase n=1 Tax=Neobacillus notoginsengisoli TaxID=1578198 RepID=A0A417YVR4_9BACI|nr:class I SAM-dependent methyltransferase [Neobacillus notoginsengisoli]RHW41455.1 class I SAM-dependent methyltransferase [Neobacillus notoginsengisoli]
MDKERYHDTLLNIKTGGSQKGFLKSIHYHPYEPTPYEALKVLFSEYSLSSRDRLVDIGCGKGRLAFYANDLFNATVVGIEMNEVFWHEAMENRTSYLAKRKKRSDKLHFYCCLAEEYEIQPEDNRFYFFNPFTLAIFAKVVHRILESAEKSPREIEMILYYPSGDYVHFLEYQTSFELVQDIPLPGLAEKNINERFLVYRLQ